MVISAWHVKMKANQDETTRGVQLGFDACLTVPYCACAHVDRICRKCIRAPIETNTTSGLPFLLFS